MGWILQTSLNPNVLNQQTPRLLPRAVVERENIQQPGDLWGMYAPSTGHFSHVKDVSLFPSLVLELKR